MESEYLDHYKVLTIQTRAWSSSRRAVSTRRLKQKKDREKSGRKIRKEKLPYVLSSLLSRGSQTRSPRKMKRAEAILLFRLEDKVCRQLQDLSLNLPEKIQQDRFLETQIREVPEEDVCSGEFFDDSARDGPDAGNLDAENMDDGVEDIYQRNNFDYIFSEPMNGDQQISESPVRDVTSLFSHLSLQKWDFFDLLSEKSLLLQ